MKAIKTFVLILFLIPWIINGQSGDLNPDALIFNTTPVHPMIGAHYGLNGLRQQNFYKFNRLDVDTFQIGDDVRWWTMNRETLTLSTAVTAPQQNTKLHLDGITLTSRYLDNYESWIVGKEIVNPNPPSSMFSIVHEVGGEIFGILYQALAIEPINHNVAIGDITPTTKLDVDGNARFRDVPLGSGNYYLRLNSDGSLAKVSFVSDARLKDNVETLTNALGQVLSMRGVSYVLRENPEAGKQHGLIAQELLQVVPELVNYDGEYYSINYEQLVGLFVEAIKEQHSLIAKQQNEINALKEVYGRIVKLERMLGVENVY